jgi:hypothetical protein
MPSKAEIRKEIADGPQRPVTSIRTNRSARIRSFARGSQIRPILLRRAVEDHANGRKEASAFSIFPLRLAVISPRRPPMKLCLQRPSG